jgi:hypothetical protein
LCTTFDIKFCVQKGLIEKNAGTEHQLSFIKQNDILVIDGVDSILQANDRIRFIGKLRELFLTLSDEMKQKFGTPRSLAYFNK